MNNLANDVPLSIWYDWHDDGPDPKDLQHHFGMVHYPYDATHAPVYSVKPTYHAAQTLTALLDGYRFNKRLKVGGSNDYALMFGRGGAERVVVCYASGDLMLAYQIVPDGNPKVASEKTLTMASPPEGPPLQGYGLLDDHISFCDGLEVHPAGDGGRDLQGYRG